MKLFMKSDGLSMQEKVQNIKGIFLSARIMTINERITDLSMGQDKMHGAPSMLFLWEKKSSHIK